MSKSLVFIFGYYFVGGAQRRAINIANYLVNHGYDITIIALLGSNGPVEADFFDIDDRINLILLPDYIKSTENKRILHLIKLDNLKIKYYKLLADVFSLLRIKNKIGEKIKTIKSGKGLKAFLRNYPNSVILHFGFNVFEPVFYATRKTNHKIIYVETNAAEKYKNEKNYSRVLNEIKLADAWIFQTKEEMFEHGMEENSRVSIIHNPINGNLPQPYIGQRKKFIVNFSAMKRQKNFILLIKSFEKFLSIFDDYELHLYCDSTADHGSDYFNELMSYINEHNLGEKVKILYMCSDIHSLIRDYSMFVLSSDYEGISNSMIEAMAIGLPTICTDCAGGGAREMIIDGYNGQLVPVNDADALCKAMLKFAENESFAQSCSENAIKIKGNLASDIIYKQWLDFIERVI